MELDDAIVAELVSILPDHDVEVISATVTRVLTGLPQNSRENREIVVNHCLNNFLHANFEPQGQEVVIVPNAAVKKRKVEALQEVAVADTNGGPVTEEEVAVVLDKASTSGAVTAARPQTFLDPNKRVEENEVEQYIKYVSEMFPFVEKTWTRGRFLGGLPLSSVIEQIVSNPGSIPKIKKPDVGAKRKAALPQKLHTGPAEHQNYFTDVTAVKDQKYRSAAHSLLINEFRRVSSGSLTHVLKFTNFHYVPAVKIVRDTLKGAEYKGGDNISVTNYPPFSSAGFRHVSHIKLHINMSIRQEKVIGNMPDELKDEITWLNNHLDADWSENETGSSSLCPAISSSMSLQEDLERQLHLMEARSRGELFECVICCDEYVVCEMLPCTEGHLFCRDCLRNHAKEIVYGQAKAQIVCLESDCTALFGAAILEKALDPEWLEKLDERYRDESVNCAEIANLIRCKYCNFAVVVDTPLEEDKVFRCPNADCEREVCRLCDEDWDEHIGLRCEELERKDETAFRTKVEEKMAEAVIRCCYACKAKLVKFEGCNKMTCRCGAKMCYLCRAPNIEYGHFCNHARNPGQACQVCSACSLWENPELKDNTALSVIEKEAKIAQESSGLRMSKVGVPRVIAPPAVPRQIGPIQRPVHYPARAYRPPQQAVRIPAEAPNAVQMAQQAQQHVYLPVGAHRPFERRVFHPPEPAVQIPARRPFVLPMVYQAAQHMGNAAGAAQNAREALGIAFDQMPPRKHR